MNRTFLHLSFFIFLSSVAFSQPGGKTENVIVITLDGFRWQELFNGADSAFLFHKDLVHDGRVAKQFWDTDPVRRREKLLPFFWQTIGTQGQLYGNRAYGNKVDCDNPHWFSYPGYSEMLVGFADRKINSNRREENPHQTILSFIHQKPEFRNKVAVFSTWGTIPYIAQSFTSGMHANAGHDLAAGDSLTAEERFLNKLQTFVPNPNGERYDAFTFFYALEYMKRERPRVVYISFDETDQHGHGARYDQYLLSAHRTDQMIALLWQELATMDFYKDNTTLIITTDHGRGKGGVRSFKKHGRLFFGSGQTWMAVLGPDTPPAGEVKTKARLYQCQLAQTIAAFLGVTYFNTRPVGDVIQTMLYPTETVRALSE